MNAVQNQCHIFPCRANADLKNTEFPASGNLRVPSGASMDMAQMFFGNTQSPQNQYGYIMPNDSCNVDTLAGIGTIGNARILIEKIIQGEAVSRYGCMVSINGEAAIYKEIPVSKYVDGKWLYEIPGFVMRKDKKALTAYLNQTIEQFQGVKEFEVIKPGWRETGGGFVYVTKRGAIGNMPFMIRSQYGQDFGWHDGCRNIGLVNEFLGMEMLTPGSPAATVICLYLILSFNYTLLKKAKVPVKFLLFLHGKRATRKTSLASAMTQLEHRDTARYTLRSTSAGLEAGFRIYKDAVMLADDLCPTQNAYEQRALHNNVELLTRSFGDGNGKQRNLDYNDNPNIQQYEAEGGAIITGEYITGVESSLSRSLFLQLKENDVDLGRLTMVQNDDTLLQRFMWGFIGYITREQKKVMDFISAKCREYRSCLQGIYSNGRYAEYHAHLQTASDLLIMFGEDTGQISYDEAVQIAQRHNAAIQNVISRNDSNLVRESSVTQLCNAITAAVESGSYHVIGRYDNSDNPSKTILVDDTYYYIPQPLLKDIKTSYDKDNGISSALLSTTYLGNLLLENGIIVAFDDGDGRRNAKAIMIGGKKARYIHVNRIQLKEHTAL